MASDTHGHRVRVFVAATIAVMIAAALLLGYVRNREPSATSAVPAPAEKLSIALPTTPHAALLCIAAAKGYFAKQGLDVTVKPVTHGKAALDLMNEGGADLASAAEVPFVISAMKGEPVGIAATVVSVSSDMALVARRDRGIARPGDLVGKRVGVTFGTSGEYFLWAFLIRHKLAPSSITMVDVPPDKLIHALTSGEVDAASAWEPIKSTARAALADNAMMLTSADAYTVTHVVVGRNDFLETHSSAIRKFVRALIQAETFANKEPRQAMALVADRFKLDAKTVQSGWDDIDFKVDLRQSQLITLEEEARWAMARGYANKGPVPNFLPHLYLDALLGVQAERVTVVH